MKRILRLMSLSFLLLPLASCGGGGSGTGLVAQLTGDSDSQVGSELQNQVFRALQRGETDDPIDD